MTTEQVERPVSIGVLGTHSTGKTTFLSQLTHELRRRRIQVATVADLGEQAQRRGMPILYNHTWTSTAWIITRGISDELEAWLHADVVLVDRAVPDALGYYRAALEYRDESPDPTALSYLDGLVRSHSASYDLLFRTTLDPSIPVGAEKARDSNLDFRLLADKHVQQVLCDLELPHDPLPASGHEHALERAITFITARLG
ncbi:AAA family ATPase [Amycolatopsis sp. NPDC059657]|uniref:AAA family ATPase n=1 Tax=Amycolatopsis sp. NPDC059657 TaxID=3346899 RepID=UPI00366D6A81